MKLLINQPGLMRCQNLLIQVISCLTIKFILLTQLMTHRNLPINPKLEQIQQKVLKEVELTDYYHMMYLKPFECILEETKGGLPKGLKIVNRIDDLKFETRRIETILSYNQFYQLSPQEVKKLEEKHQQSDKIPRNYKNYLEYCRQNNGDNLLVQMKCAGNMQMAICVCMYNEDREMMNNTLLGIGENIAKLYKKGVDPDKIVVIIVQDGIQKMDKSIQQFMQVLEAESSIKFGQAKEKKFQSALKQISQLQQTRKDYKWDGEDSIIDLNCFLFDKNEEQNRQSLRFTSIKKQYDNIKKLYVEVQKLQKDKTITHEDLPPRVLQVFKKECKKYRLGEQDTNEDTPELLEKYFEEVSVDINISRPLVQNALTKMGLYCKQYIDSRQQMSHVSFFRTSQFFPDDSGFSMTELDEIRKKSKIISVLKENQQESKFITQNLDWKLSIKMNIFFVVKYKNAQKLSSHNWFFNGFCKQFSNFETQPQVKPANRSPAPGLGQAPNQAQTRRHQNLVYSPKYTILLDVGLRPQESALCKMYYTLENHNSTIGGVCGYMGLKLERTGQDQQKITQDLDFFTKIFLNFVDIQRAQQLEYHFAHLIDKGFESIFKFIHVLPGAFSGYNMKAIWGDGTKNADELLQSYFKSIGEKVSNKKYDSVDLSFWKIIARVVLPNYILNCFTGSQKQTYQSLMYQSNVYLAEDRILCMGIHQNGYDLMFLPDAYSFVDPVKDIPALLGQRKRWINGSYFAFEKVSKQFSQMGIFQCLDIQIWYLSLMNLLAYIAPGFFLFSISVAMEAFKADVLVKFFSDSLKQDSPVFNAFVYTINFIYAMLIFGLIYFSMSLTNRNKQFIRFVYGVSTILGVMSIIMLTILVVDLARGLGRSNSYLIDNQSNTFVKEIPGGQATVDAIRYIVLGIMGLYAVPLLLYSICFRTCRVITQIIAGAISFAFYTPTYLIILNIYALCRMDDLSWGTKGLDSGGDSKDKAILDCWKIIKTIHVGKLVFWNVLVAGFLIHFGSNYLLRFWLTLALMIIIASTMAFKVLCGVIYYFYYLFFINSKKKDSSSNERQRIEQDRNAEKLKKKYPDPDALVLTIKPSLYSALKNPSKEKNKQTLIDELNDEIKRNIQFLSTGLGDVTNVINMQFASFVQKGTKNQSQLARQFNPKISLMMSHAKKKSQTANKNFEEMRKKNPPILLSPQKKPQKFDTQQSLEKTLVSKMEPQGTGLLQKTGGFFPKINVFGGDKDKQKVLLNSNDDKSMVGLTGSNEVKKQINFHQLLKK